jgi:hypothetical protein
LARLGFVAKSRCDIGYRSDGKARLAELGSTPLAESPDDFGKLIADETNRWAKVIKFANIKRGVRSGEIP